MTAVCACRGYMTKPGTEHTEHGCSVVPIAVTEAFLAAIDGERSFTADELEVVNEWCDAAGVERVPAAAPIDVAMRAAFERPPE